MIRIGLLGVGKWGENHLNALRDIPAFEVVGFWDPDAEVAARVSAQYGIPAFPSRDALLDAVDAVDIVSPTDTHYEHTRAALKKFRHVFLEIPITKTTEEAKALLMLSREAGVKVQIGHDARFSPAFTAARNLSGFPLFIEGNRQAPWNPRNAGMSVVHELMLHDIDLVLSLVRSPVKRVSGSGASVIGEHTDIANARIEFTNGTVAHLNVSRLGRDATQTLQMFQKTGILRIDLLNGRADRYQVQDMREGHEPEPSDIQFLAEDGEHSRFLRYEAHDLPTADLLRAELESFANSIQQDSAVSVTLEEAAAALETALQIADKINTYSHS